MGKSERVLEELSKRKKKSWHQKQGRRMQRVIWQTKLKQSMQRSLTITMGLKGPWNNGELVQETWE